MSLGDLRDKLIRFHLAMNVPILSTPTVPADERVRLRAKLIIEEAIEFVEACYGIDPKKAIHPTGTRAGQLEMDLDDLKGRIGDILENLPVAVDLAEAADALADIAYVVEGANLEFGIDSGPVLDEVHAANMRKTTGPIREDGKRLKPPGWIGPDIVAVLERQRA